VRSAPRHKPKETTSKPRTPVRQRTSTPFSALMDALVDGMIAMDERGTIEYLNPAAERMFGYRSEEVLGRPATMLVPEPHRAHLGDNLHAFFGAGEAGPLGVRRELIGRRKDGMTFPMDLAGQRDARGQTAPVHRAPAGHHGAQADGAGTGLRPRPGAGGRAGQVRVLGHDEP
jgi:PAS domain S-box-containing protein